MILNLLLVSIQLNGNMKIIQQYFWYFGCTAQDDRNFNIFCQRENV